MDGPDLTRNQDRGGGILTGDGSRQLGRTVLRLAHEFSAPAGLVDPETGAWLVRHGAASTAFPALAATQTRPLVAGGFDPTRSTVVRPDGPEGVAWLLLPVGGPAGLVVGAAGFAPQGAGGAPPQPSASCPRPQAWGAPCPDAALRAWGQVVASRLSGLADSRVRQTAVSDAGNGAAAGSSGLRSSASRLAVGDSGEGLLVARVIRRLRVSDAPSRFQALACNAVRASLGAHAVAWVPAHPAEPVVVSAEGAAPTPEVFRALVPPLAGSGVMLDNAPAGGPDPTVGRLLAVAADTQGNTGWVVAVNPPDARAFVPADVGPLRPIAALIAAQQSNARVYADLKELLFGVIRALTAAIDAKDPYTSGHSERVARIAVRLGEELGMSAGQRSDLYLMGLLHDVGKIGIDDAVLKKTGPLTPEEYRQIQRHVEIGVQILADLKKLGHLLPGVRHHHESLDGSGYPCGLAGESIPFEARILAVADSFDAMSSTRPYRRRLTPSQIDEILRKGSGQQWDPKVIDALFACRMDLETIRQKGLGESLQIAVSGALVRNPNHGTEVGRPDRPKGWSPA